MTKHIAAAWVVRSTEPAKSPPDENFPYGVAADLTDGRLPACVKKLQYPAPGVGSWVLSCGRCGSKVVVTAAGRADDPTQVTMPCGRKASS